MTPDEAAQTAEYFLKYYVEGAQRAGGSSLGADYSGWQGIFLRYPALLGPAPDFDVPNLSECDERCFAAGEGPESCSEPYIFVDRCPIARVRVTRAGSKLDVVFVGVVDFPVNAFPKSLSVSAGQLKGRRIALPSAMSEPQQIAVECLSRLADYLGTDISLLEISYDVIAMRYEDYNGDPLL